MAGSYAVKPVKPICYVKCATTKVPVCAGPILGSGQLLDFTNSCYLTSYNCMNYDNSKQLMRSIAAKILSFFICCRIWS